MATTSHISSNAIASEALSKFGVMDLCCAESWTDSRRSTIVLVSIKHICALITFSSLKDCADMDEGIDYTQTAGGERPRNPGA